MNAARFHFAQVDEELGEQLVRATHEAAGPSEELGVGEMFEPRSCTMNGPVDRCDRLHASHDNAAVSALSIGALASDLGLKGDANRRTEQELSRAPAALARATFRVARKLARASATNTVKTNLSLRCELCNQKDVSAQSRRAS